jgi:hypothetical protein
VCPARPEKQLPLTGFPVALRAGRQMGGIGRAGEQVLPLPHRVRQIARDGIREPPGCRQRTAKAGHVERKVVRYAVQAGEHVRGGRCRTKTLRGRLQTRRRGLRSPRRRTPWQVPRPPEGSLTTESSYRRGPARGRPAPGLSCRAGGAGGLFLGPARAPTSPPARGGRGCPLLRSRGGTGRGLPTGDLGGCARARPILQSVVRTAASPAAARAAIAQLDRATDYGSVGWGFDSSWLHHFYSPQSKDLARSISGSVRTNTEARQDRGRIAKCGRLSSRFPLVALSGMFGLR